MERWKELWKESEIVREIVEREGFIDRHDLLEQTSFGWLYSSNIRWIFMKWEWENFWNVAPRSVIVKGNSSTIYMNSHNINKSPVLKHGPRSLPVWQVFGRKPRMRNESECGTFLCTTRGRSTYLIRSVEPVWWDPKDGELCLNRVKPEETLVEARSGSDVQIDRQIWV